MGSLLSSFSFLSMGGSVLGVTVSLLLATIMLALWALVLMVLHPLHATMFVLAALFEYVLISLCGFSLWFDFIAFLVFYILIVGTYTWLLRRWLLPVLPHHLQVPRYASQTRPQWGWSDVRKYYLHLSVQNVLLRARCCGIRRMMSDRSAPLSHPSPDRDSPVPHAPVMSQILNLSGLL